jgi:putative sterol carrier protein
VAYKFLSDEWATAVSDALSSHPGFKSSIANADLTLQFNVTGAPDGDKAYYLQAAGGDADIITGTNDAPDVTVGQTYDTAVAISKGDLNTQSAFMTGKLKVSGNLAKLMMHQAAIAQWQSAVRDIEVEY